MIFSILPEPKQALYRICILFRKAMKKVEKVKAYCLTLPEAVEDYPFGPDIQVFKIKEKMFGLMTYRKGVARINLKCDPEEAIILREIHDDVIPGYHMNKAHWNTVLLNGKLPLGEIRRMINRSYSLVVRKLRRDSRESLELRHGIEKLYRSDRSFWV